MKEVVFKILVDFIGQYIGEFEVKIVYIFDLMIGKVFIIDDVYMFYYGGCLGMMYELDEFCFSCIDVMIFKIYN